VMQCVAALSGTLDMLACYTTYLLCASNVRDKEGAKGGDA